MLWTVRKKIKVFWGNLNVKWNYHHFAEHLAEYNKFTRN